MKAHPHYESLLAKGRPGFADEREWVFLRASIWPDLIRPPPDFAGDTSTDSVLKFHQSTWHYINHPYLVGEHPKTLPTPIVDLPTPRRPMNSSVREQTLLSMAYLMRATPNDPGQVPGTTEAENRAVRLCWLLHLIGDVHQPMHTVSLVDQTRFPADDHGDQGGNLLAVQRAVGEAPIRLHAYWDDLLGDSFRWNEIAKTADAIGQLASSDGAGLPEIAQHPNLDDWILEGYLAAIEYAYLDGELPLTAFRKDMPKDSAPVLDAETQQRAAATAQHRGALAAVRIAKVLTECLR